MEFRPASESVFILTTIGPLSHQTTSNHFGSTQLPHDPGLTKIDGSCHGGFGHRLGRPDPESYAFAMNDKQFTNRMRQLRNLVAMAMADGSIGEREVAFVADRCHELGFGESELSHAIRYGLSDDAALELPTDPAERNELMVDLIRMMAADGVLEESEKRLFALAAAKMEITSEQLNRLIDKTLE